MLKKHWKIKALIQTILSSIPGGEIAYYALQRHVTKTLPPSTATFTKRFPIEASHIENFCKYGKTPLNEASFYQFGAGWTMAGPLVFYALGANKQILIDLRMLIRPDLINASIVQVQRLAKQKKDLRAPTSFVSRSKKRAVCQLHEKFGIRYSAPADARHTGLESNSLDCITTTNTLEHIPKADLPAILKECHRILKPDGIISFRVDYQDHYSYFDSTISAYNFLAYDHNHWEKYNPPLHYQNRMRHFEYLHLYKDNGFDIVEEHNEQGSEEDIQLLQNMTLAKEFTSARIEDLAIKNSLTILKKVKTYFS